MSETAMMGAQPSGLRRLGQIGSLGHSLIGLVMLVAVWWAGAWAARDSLIFADMAPPRVFARLWSMVISGEAWAMAAPSLQRILLGLGIALAIGVPVGVLIGMSRRAAEIANAPFQFLRMISPLSWMPFAVVLFTTWDGAIVFLIAVATVWPILFSTAAGVRRMHPAWGKVATNLGANLPARLRHVVLPAIAPDIVTGLRLALGIAWVVLVPAEYLGVTSGLGYAINDARDSLDYARLGATVLQIGVIGWALDLLCLYLLRRVTWLRST